MLKMTDLDLHNKRVLIRVDLNVPMENGRITSTTRIQAILPALRLALEQNARVILMSHLGRPKAGIFDATLSLQPIADYLSILTNQPIQFIKNFENGICVEPGQIALLENTRFLIGEKENDPTLSQRLARLCDVFVMDAFATAHRKEASTYGVAQFAPIACAGPLLVSEMAALQQVLHNPQSPVVAVVGGAKVSSKLLVLKNLLKKVDTLIVGGGIANTFLAAKGYAIGNSLYEPNLIAEAKEMLAYAQANHKNIPLPEDVVVAKQLHANATAVHKNVYELYSDDMILDMGPRTIALIEKIIHQANTILWNGPLGVFEYDQFGEGTKALANAIAQSRAYSVAGGGDTLAAIEKYQVENELSYISTGGGAFLEFLEGKTLPAIDILEKRSHENNVVCNDTD